MSQTMREVEWVESMKSVLARPTGTATTEERAASEEFYSIHDAIIRAMIRRIHRAPDVVDDLAQQVWVELIERLKELSFDPALGSVTGLVVKMANDAAKKHARCHAKRRQEPLTPEAADKLADPEPGPDIEFELTQNEADLRKLIEGFAATLRDKHDQLVVRLYWLEERSLSRIAVDMMISADCAWGILRRVAVKLADYLRGRGYGGPLRKKRKNT